jgi:CRP/FNR family transcriptional regulator
MEAPLGPYNLRVIESCLNCPSHENHIFCNLAEPLLRELNSLRQNAFYPRGAILFVEGESPRGVFVLCSGRARLSATSVDGQTISLREVEPGEILGLSSAMSKSAYSTRAETLTACQISFIPQLQFRSFLRAHPDVSLRIAEHLSMELHKAWEQTRLVTLLPTTRAKLARFFLAWAAGHGKVVLEGATLSLKMTQEEIAESIGVSRETVSRALAHLQDQQLIRVNRGQIVILQPGKLHGLAAS